MKMYCIIPDVTVFLIDSPVHTYVHNAFALYNYI